MPDNTAAAAKTMPSRSHHSAPKFDGKPASLSIFIDEIELLAGSSGLSNKQTIEWTIRYAPSDERELWQLQNSVGTEDWEQFKKEIFDLYPGSTGERKYSIANLAKLVEKQTFSNITNAEEFGTYRRAFLAIATYLKNKARLSDREISLYFLQGLDTAIRTKVQEQLRAENPKHHTDDPFTLAEISSAALFVLSCNHSNITSPTMTPEIPIKKETFDMTQGFGNINISAIATEVARQLSMQLNNTSHGQNCQHTTENGSVTRQKNCNCIFCSDPAHFVGGCPDADGYCKKGLCKKNNEGQIVLPNGDRILSKNIPGRNLKERIDNWHKSNTNNTVSTNYIGSKEIGAGYVWITEEKGEEPILPTKREEEELEVLENLVASTQKKIDTTRKRMENGRTTRNNITPQTRTPQDRPAQSKDVTSSPEPQFRYITPIENPDLIKKVAQSTLDVPITLSSRELLSISPDVRKYIKEQITTKRVTTSALIEATEEENSGRILLSSVPTDKLIVANHVEDLRAIDVVIGETNVEATLDDGSQIISIRQDLWERLGVPLRSDRLMVMESANKSKDRTLGLLQDFKISIGGNDFYLQIQVVRDAPYELLLGRPFYTLTAATHQNFTCGDSRLILTDPNTNEQITIPTRPKKQSTSDQGF